MQDWIITLPKTADLQKWKEEIREVSESDGKLSLFFKVPPNFKAAQKGDRCFITHNGQVLGFHIVRGVRKMKGFTCQTTGTVWKEGTYLERGGHFYSAENHYTWRIYNEDALKVKGFQGIRSFPEGKKLKTCGYAGCDDKYRNRQPCALCYE